MLSRLKLRRFGRSGAATTAAAVVLTLAGAVLASAAGPVPSNLKLLEAGTTDGQYASIGLVASPKGECASDRKVKFVVKRPGGNELLDVARTSDRGGWSSFVPEVDYLDGGVSGTLYKLVPRKVKKGGKTIRCGGDQVSPA